VTGLSNNLPEFPSRSIGSEAILHWDYNDTKKANAPRQNMLAAGFGGRTIGSLLADMHAYMSDQAGLYKRSNALDEQDTAVSHAWLFCGS
jgi:hypothetical protein